MNTNKTQQTLKILKELMVRDLSKDEIINLFEEPISRSTFFRYIKDLRESGFVLSKKKMDETLYFYKNRG